MKAHAEATVSDADFAKRAERWPVDTPDTKEGYYIREIFESKFFLNILLYLLINYSLLWLSHLSNYRPLPDSGSRQNRRQMGPTRRLGLFIWS